jgi:hypothetical protein
MSLRQNKMTVSYVETLQRQAALVKGQTAHGGTPLRPPPIPASAIVPCSESLFTPSRGIGAVVNLKVENHYPSGKRFFAPVQGKGGKEKELSVHSARFLENR